VTGRNTPPAVNAVFNFDNFWDGRGKHDFNGSSPIGSLDQGSGVWTDPGSNGTLTKVKVAIPNSSLASQSVGPPMSSVEMSWNGRTWPKLGRKMLSLTPLGQQPVSPTDSVLGPLSRASLQGGKLSGAKGLNTTYVQMIKDAFVDSWWNSTGTTPDGFTQIEANFSLIWGLAVQHYEATLVSDQTPVDQFLAGNTAALSASAQNGLNRFNSQCSSCHSGSETTGASVSNAEAAIAATGTLIELGATATAGSISDIGFSNIGVMPTADNPGRGGVINFPLSFAGEALVTDPTFTPPFILPPLATTASPLAVNGAFKIPSLRNVELTAPYMHNGSLLILQQVVDFYNLGGNFPNNPELDAEMKAFAFNSTQRNEMVDFLTALTDERVRNESAPFDHPQLILTEGDGPVIVRNATDAVGTSTESTIPPGLSLNALVTPTRNINATVTGKVEAGIVPVVQGANAGPVTFNGTTWSCAVTLSKGNNSLSVKATDPVGNVTTQTAQINVILPDGCLKGGAAPDIGDALKALRIAVNLDQPTAEEMLHGDVAPLVNNIPAPDNKIDIADCLTILKKVVGQINF
jgi:cytochrome c peroxidase